MEKLYRWLAITFLVTLVALITASYMADGIAFVLLSPEIDNAQRVEALRDTFAALGGAAPLAYIAMVVIEVVIAPIPGTLLYLPGGIIFGGFFGGLWSLIANILGAGISCQLMRSIVGRRATSSFFEKHHLVKLRDLLENRGMLFIILLRLNPLTSSDLVSYAAGLTTMRASKVMVASGIGLAPLCFAQSYLAASLFDSFPWLIWPMLIACVLYVIGVVAILWRLGQKQPPTK